MKIFNITLICFLMSTNLTCAKTSQQKVNPYDIYKFEFQNSFIALSPLPGRVDLESDLQKIKENQIENVLTLVSSEELSKYGVPTLLNRFEEMEMDILHSPIVDYGLPTHEQMKTILKWLYKKVKSKENILIHCVGGLGRSGTVMAVYAKIYLGMSATDAIQYVRSIRGNGAVETAEQEKFVEDWK